MSVILKMLLFFARIYLTIVNFIDLKFEVLRYLMNFFLKGHIIRDLEFSYAFNREYMNGTFNCSIEKADSDIFRMNASFNMLKDIPNILVSFENH